MAWASLRDHVVDQTMEQLDQATSAFNAASNFGLIASTPRNVGDFVDNVTYAAINSTRRRARADGNAAEAAALVDQKNDIAVNVPGAVGPHYWGADAPQWQGQTESGIVTVLSRRTTELILKDYINTAAATLVAALTQAGDAVSDISAGVDAAGQLSFKSMNSGAALLGDASGMLSCYLMSGAARHVLVGNAIDNGDLFSYESINVFAGPDGKPIVVSDCPALTETTAAFNVLGLMNSAAEIGSKGDPVMLMDEKGGKNITREFQADYSFDVKLKSFAYGGTPDPTDAELATGANWTKTYADRKAGPGFLLKTNQFGG